MKHRVAIALMLRRVVRLPYVCLFFSVTLCAVAKQYVVAGRRWYY